ncbi:RNA ligase (ATP) [soil metagenome]
MSSLIVEVCKIEKVLPHQNAERLELAHIKGWQCVVPRGRYQAGDLVTYVPVDSVLPDALAERLGVKKYLSKGRVRCARLRGEPSFGLIIDRENDNWALGTDVSAHYGIEKFIPPIKLSAGDAEVPHALFDSYTEIENMRNFPDIFTPGESVIATEKIHGTNCRLGLIVENGEHIEMAGSKQIRRKRPTDLASDLYWFPWTVVGVRELLREVTLGPRRAKQAILFGEVFGRVQSLRYGRENALAFRAFDLLIDGKYVDSGEFASLCKQFGIEQVPSVFEGPCDLQKIRELSDGPSLISGANHIREGVVVKPVAERTDPKIGRVILKYIGDSYLLGESISDTQDV